MLFSNKNLFFYFTNGLHQSKHDWVVVCCVPVAIRPKSTSERRRSRCWIKSWGLADTTRASGRRGSTAQVGLQRRARTPHDPHNLPLHTPLADCQPLSKPVGEIQVKREIIHKIIFLSSHVHFFKLLSKQLRTYYPE